MTGARGGAHLLILRLAWWGAVALLVVQLAIWPGILDEPSFLIGSREGDYMEPRLIPLALVAWLFVGRRLIARARTAAEK
jgi:hypothetical protein